LAQACPCRRAPPPAATESPGFGSITPEKAWLRHRAGIDAASTRHVDEYINMNAETRRFVLCRPKPFRANSPRQR